MLDTDLEITSTEPGTGRPVTVTFTGGRARWTPRSAVVFVGSTRRDGPPSEISCGCLNFFTTRQAARNWHAVHPEVTGGVLNQATAERQGRQQFGALLA